MTTNPTGADIGGVIAELRRLLEAAAAASNAQDQRVAYRHLSHAARRDLPSLLSHIAGLEETTAMAVSALEEAEAILGGEYGDFYGVLCERMAKLRSALSHEQTRIEE